MSGVDPSPVRGRFAGAGLAAVLAACGMGSGGARAEEGESTFEGLVQPFLRRHCFACHGEGKRRGQLALDALSADLVDGPSVSRWNDVVRKLQSGEMPPADQPDRPSAEQIAEVSEWLAQRIRVGRSARLARREPVSLCRLSRAEYTNTVFDLLGVRVDPADLPPDEDDHGWERVGAVMSISAAHLERYLSVAEQVLAEVLPGTAVLSRLERRTAIDLLGGREGIGEDRHDRLAQTGRLQDVRVDLWPGQEVRAGSLAGSIEHPGMYRFRVQVSGCKPAAGRAPRLAVRAAPVDRVLYERNVVTAEDQPMQLEFEAHLPAGPQVFSLHNAVAGPTILQLLSRKGSRPFFSLEEGRVPWQVPLVSDAGEALVPLLVVDWIEWEGPLPDHAPRTAPGLAAREVSTDREARAFLASFVPRAFRRPLGADEVDRHIASFAGARARGSSVREALRLTLLAILCSHEFLYLVEGSGQRSSDLLTDAELAARLAYFLFSSPPDTELLSRVREGSLQRPGVLRREVLRMLADVDRAGGFGVDFPRQWLQLDRVGLFPPDAELYPEYDRELEQSMLGETTAFFAEVLRRNLGLREFLASDWTMINARLADHYGIDGVFSDRFERTALRPEDHRGGILTHASVLSLTSDGTRHRPVHRGVWILESIFGDPPLPPPPDVEPIEPGAADAPRTTVREQLVAHRSQAGCVRCHAGIDPLGLAFDSYDAIGRWRREERVPIGTGGYPEVDASGVLVDGRPFGNTREFQQLLVEDLDRFAAAFVESLAGYALRRKMTVDDRDELQDIVQRSRADDYRLQTVIQYLVLSSLFRRR